MKVPHISLPFRYLSRNNELQSYYFAVSKMCLDMMGYWPGRQRSARTLLWAISNFVILFIGVLTEFIAGFQALKDDLSLGFETLCPATTSGLTLLKMFLISNYREDLRHVLERMQQVLYPGDVRISPAKEKIMRWHSIVAVRLNFWAFMSAWITATAFNFKPLILAWYQWWQEEEVIWQTPFNMRMPAVFLRAPLFPLTYIFTSYTGYVTIYMFNGCAAFYFEFCSYIAMAFKMLQEDIKALFQQHEGKMVLTSKENAFLSKELAQIVRTQNKLVELRNIFLKRYTIITVVHFVSAGIVIGASIVNLTTMSGFGVFIYIVYTLASLIELFIYCFGGTLMEGSSSNMATVLFTCDWNICNPQLRRMILLIMLRSQRALTMDVPFFSPSLHAFSSIVRTAGSIFAVAKSFQ